MNLVKPDTRATGDRITAALAKLIPEDAGTFGCALRRNYRHSSQTVESKSERRPTAQQKVLDAITDGSVWSQLIFRFNTMAGSPLLRAG